MKTNKDKKPNNKFDLKKFEIAKLKNMHLITGGDAHGDDPIDTAKNNGRSSIDCNR